MAEKKLNLILDGGAYKVSFTKDGKQQKVTLGNEKSLSLLAARNMTNQIEEIWEANYSSSMLKKMYQINEDVIKCGYSGQIIKYQCKSLELAMRIMHIDEYEDWQKEIQESNSISLDEVHNMEPLEILNVGCTATGKTRFILGVILNDNAMKNFAPSLTSIKETTACSIAYHINSRLKKFTEKNDFCIEVDLKDENEVLESIKMLVTEAAEEYIETIRNKSKDSENIAEIKSTAIKAVEKRLEMNYDKTFGLGQNNLNKEIASQIEKLIINGMVDYYGASKSISKKAEADEEYIIKQLIRDFNQNSLEITYDEIFAILNQYTGDENPFEKIVGLISDELMSNLKKFNAEYRKSVKEGNMFAVEGVCENELTLDLVSHIFGNKSKQRKGEYYTIEPLLKSAEIYFKVERLDIGREIILTDSIGINQGQKDSARLKEIATNRVQESIQKRKPEIVIYHTRILTNDDYMLDIIKNLNMQGFGKRTYVIAGRLDTVFNDRLSNDGYEIEEVDSTYFEEFIQELYQTYVEKDSVTLSTIIGERYLLCDKTNQLGKKLSSAEKFHSTSIFNMILESYINTKTEVPKYNDVNFVGMLHKNYICSKVYKRFLSSIPRMVPMEYSKMRWNTLQKAIETLYSNGYGFDILYPAIILKNIIAEEFSIEENALTLEKIFGDDTDTIKRRYLIEVAEVAQIVLVTGYRAFMIRLLRMRYDSGYRTDFNTSMTNDRKQNLQSMYSTCLEQGSLQGEFSLLIVLHIAWIRTQEFFEMKNTDGESRDRV